LNRYEAALWRQAVQIIEKEISRWVSLWIDGPFPYRCVLEVAANSDAQLARSLFSDRLFCSLPSDQIVVCINWRQPRSLDAPFYSEKYVEDARSRKHSIIA
jgi:hypothetical protein